ncbi:MAG: HD domain-containing protein [Kiritimatiellales bacterium]|nr:HD domain-containing protein [Kiritimatiellales bacterium]
MNPSQLQAIQAHFLEYSGEYIRRSGPMVGMMELKREHCANVAINCRTLANAMDWTADDANTAEALGYIHDVGRFPQLEEYGTFMDAKSIDHGARGYQAIMESDLLHGLEEERRQAVLNAVRYHNKKTLPANLPESHYPYLKLIRDADRLDIYRVVYEAIVNGTIADHPEIGLSLTLEGTPNQAVIDTVERREPVTYSQLKCFADFLLLLISWTYQMNYPASLGIMRESQTIEKFSEYLPMELPMVGTLVSNVRNYLDDSAV